METIRRKGKEREGGREKNEGRWKEGRKKIRKEGRKKERTPNSDLLEIAHAPKLPVELDLAGYLF